jgi:hypothetical protein
MSDVAWVVVGLIVGTIAFEVWISAKKLDADMRSLELWVASKEDED